MSYVPKRKIAPTRYVKARPPNPSRRMNELETAYAERLQILKAAGEIVAYWFENFKVRMADRTWYTPDFLVVTSDLTIEIHEVKGHWKDDARVKWKTCAELYPIFKWLAIQRKKGEWKVEEYGTGPGSR